VWHSPFKLYLYPDNPDIDFEYKQLEALLNTQELIGAEITNGRFATGNRFLSLLTFMGCSPDIEIYPQDDKPFCYIEIEASETPRFIAGRNTSKASCPNCKTAIDRIPKPIETQLNCPSCELEIELAKLNWRKSAFIAKSWIVIGNIYEFEAVPNDELLIALEKTTGVKWKSAYIREFEN
jgi:hypothetical protein